VARWHARGALAREEVCGDPHTPVCARSAECMSAGVLLSSGPHARKAAARTLIRRSGRALEHVVPLLDVGLERCRTDVRRRLEAHRLFAQPPKARLVDHLEEMSCLLYNSTYQLTANTYYILKQKCAQLVIHHRTRFNVPRRHGTCEIHT
jgi:hypothetical protein